MHSTFYGASSPFASIIHKSNEHLSRFAAINLKTFFDRTYEPLNVFDRREFWFFHYWMEKFPQWEGSKRRRSFSSEKSIDNVTSDEAKAHAPSKSFSLRKFPTQAATAIIVTFGARKIFSPRRFFCLDSFQKLPTDWNSWRWLYTSPCLFLDETQRVTSQ